MHCAKGSQLFKLMLGYYAFRPILVFDTFAACMTLMAAMFTVTSFQRHNEMTALMAAGISRIRILAPVIVAAIAILVLAAINREAVMPRFRVGMSQQPAIWGTTPWTTSAATRQSHRRAHRRQGALPEPTTDRSPKFRDAPGLAELWTTLDARTTPFSAPRRAIAPADTSWSGYSRRRTWSGSRRWNSRDRRC